MTYSIYYHPDVKKTDLPKLPQNIRNRIRRAIENRLMANPVSYSAPLRKSLKGYRKLRVGDYRVIFRLDKTMIKVLIIGHRKDVYESTPSRMPRGDVG